MSFSLKLFCFLVNEYFIVDEYRVYLFFFLLLLHDKVIPVHFLRHKIIDFLQKRFSMIIRLKKTERISHDS